jgi:HSP20 family protein
MAKAKQSLERGSERHREMRGRESQPTGGSMHAPLAPFSPFSPFAMMNRFAEEMERMFEDFGFGRGWLAPRLRPGMGEIGHAMWLPQIEIFERGGQFIVRADLPGLTKEDVKVDITDEALTIQGERKQEQEEEREGWHRSERSYGSFYRSIQLPEGAKAEEAKANFRDGVLEISMPAPEREGRRRQIEIS